MDECLYVPVRWSADGSVSPRIARLPEGTRTGLAFTSAASLAAACRDGQPWIRLSDGALRALLTPLGVTRIQYDPVAVRNVPLTHAA